MRPAYIGLGSNLDQPEGQIRDALRRLNALPETTLDGCSRLFRTPPWGLAEQPSFINAVARLRTGLDPQDLLEALMAIERAMGRERSVVWGPRRIDLDLLHIEGVVINEHNLELPHPRLHQRGFVLLPWLDLEPRATVPGHGELHTLIARVDCSGIEPLP